MTEERARFILDRLMDLAVDNMGFSTVVEELKTKYDCELTEEELQFIVKSKS